MSKFDYDNFTDGWDREFVVHAKKFTKKKVLSLFKQENNHLFSMGYRKPTISDITEKAVRYYPVAPIDFQVDGGSYGYCPKGQRGSFPVWVIEFKGLEI